MKPTDKQRKICDAIIREISWWRDTNDIHSQSIYSNMDGCLSADLDDEIGESERCMIQQKLVRIFEIVKWNK